MVLLMILLRSLIVSGSSSVTGLDFLVKMRMSITKSACAKRNSEILATTERTICHLDSSVVKSWFEISQNMRELRQLQELVNLSTYKVTKSKRKYGRCCRRGWRRPRSSWESCSWTVRNIKMQLRLTMTAYKQNALLNPSAYIHGKLRLSGDWWGLEDKYHLKDAILSYSLCINSLAYSLLNRVETIVIDFSTS